MLANAGEECNQVIASAHLLDRLPGRSASCVGMALSFVVAGRSAAGQARAGAITTSRNTILTPCFMPVGTHAAVTAMTPAMLADHGAAILVCNAFRLFEKPGPAIARRYSSLHEFMAWPGTILTDSGGFQVYRLASRKVSEQGVEFYTEERKQVFWTPEKAIEVQAILGGDFVMPLDVCVSLPASHGEADAAMTRTLRWAERCQAAGLLGPRQTLFGIVQGAVYEDLRVRCIDGLVAMGFAGYAIGGLNVGESAEEYRRTLAFTCPRLPDSAPRYLMGVGRPEAMLDAVSAGVDLMDSIVPTKYAREGRLITSRGTFNISKSRYAKDRFPVDPSCQCYTCQNVTRGYLHHVYQTTRATAQMWAAIHNVAFCLRLMSQAREAILADRFGEFHAEFRASYQTKGQAD